MTKKATNPSALVASLKAAAHSSARSRLYELSVDEKDKSLITQENAELPSFLKTGSEEFFDILINNLHEGDWNARKFYIDSRVDDLAASLKSLGQEVPINVYKDDAGRFVIQDGHYRLRAAKRAGLRYLRAQLKPTPPDAITAFITSRAINLERNDQSVLDDAFRLKELVDAGASNQKEIGGRLGLEESEISKLLALTKLSESIILTLMRDASLLSKRFLYNLSIYFDRYGEGDTLELAVDAVKNGMSARELELRLKSNKRGPSEKPRSQTFLLTKDQIKGYVKSFPTGRIELKLEGLSREDQEIILAKLKSVLS